MYISLKCDTGCEMMFKLQRGVCPTFPSSESDSSMGK
jgi:hypothetical protein